MYEEIKTLKTENRTASQKRRAEIDARMQELYRQNPEEYAKAFEQSLKDTIVAAETMLIREQMKPILKMVSLAYIAKTYFNKSNEWLYQRVNGYSVNGKTAAFSPEEIKTLNRALQDIGKTIGSVQVSL